MPELEIRFRDLAASDEGLLQEFFRKVYVPEFPDPNERESEENIRGYLRLKAEGWYQDNQYHVVIMLDRGGVVGGAIFDYLSLPNSATVEFITVAASHRGRGVGSSLMDEIRRLAATDAHRAGRLEDPWIFGETEDPFRAPPSSSPGDPFTRLDILQSMGARLVRFPYVQPSLGPGKRAVRHLRLIALPPGGVSGPAPESLPMSRVLSTIHEYMLWAFRIPRPDRHRCYREMAAGVLGIGQCLLEPVEGLSLSHRAAMFQEPERPDDPRIDQALAVYDDAIRHRALKVPRDHFAKLLREWLVAGRPGTPSCRYHFVTVGEPGNRSAVAGMLSCFTLRPYSFIGYVALAPEARGRGLGRDLVRWAERLAVRDMRPAGIALAGAFAEVDRGSGTRPTPQYGFVRSIGFEPVQVSYLQPPLPSQPRPHQEHLELVHRPGGVDGRACLTGARLNAFLASLGRHVYNLSPRKARAFAEGTVRSGFS